MKHAHKSRALPSRWRLGVAMAILASTSFFAGLLAHGQDLPPETRKAAKEDPAPPKAVVDLEPDGLVRPADYSPGAFLLPNEGKCGDYEWDGLANTIPLVLHISSEFELGAEVTLTVSDASMIRIFDATDPTPVAVIGPTTAAFPETPVASWSQVLADQPGNLHRGDLTFRVEGVATGTVTATLQCQKGGQSLGTDTITINVAGIDLDAMKINAPGNAENGELADAEETTVGAFLPVNDDDDDYDDGNKPDCQQQGSIAGESDLLPIVLRGISPAALGGHYTLAIPTGIRVWRNADRSGPVAADATFDMTDPQAESYLVKLYVEATEAGVSTLGLNWTDGTRSLESADSVKLTAFTMHGPLNVPDYSIHRYIAGGDLPEGSQWIAPGGESGTIKTGEETSDVTILWGAGARVGKARYRVNDSYTWESEVNVVEVKIESPEVGDAFTAGTPCDGGNHCIDPEDPLTKRILSGNVEADPAEPGLRWQAKVTLTGPNGNRGVPKMRIGFVQTVDVCLFRGYYQRPSGEIMILGSCMEGNSYLDRGRGVAFPYYGDKGDSVFFDPSVDKRDKVIGTMDTPNGHIPLTLDQGKTVEESDVVLSSTGVDWRFSLNVIANTTDSMNDGNRVFTSRAKANWRFNGCGLVGQTAPYRWTTIAVTGVTKPEDGWESVTDGSQPTIKDDEGEPSDLDPDVPSADDVIRNNTFSPVQQ